MNEIYWITRLDAIESTLVALICISGLVLLFAVVGYFVTRGEDLEGYKTSIRMMKKSVIVTIVSTILLIFIPNQKQALMICGIGGTIDYIKSNETAKKLPDKCIQAIDKYLGEIVGEDKKQKSE